VIRLARQRNAPDAWEEYWTLVADDPAAQVPWHFGTAEETAPYLPGLRADFDPALPLVDAGCGDGVLTEHLAAHFEPVLGTDVAASALARARARAPRSRVRYEQWDTADVPSARRLHERTGDVNVHLRGVLHAMNPVRWSQAMAALAVLTGARGRVFDIEISPEFGRTITAVRQRFGALPAALQHGAHTGVGPLEFPAASLADLYRRHGWRLLRTEELVLDSKVRLPDGEFLAYPFTCVFAEPHR